MKKQYYVIYKYDDIAFPKEIPVGPFNEIHQCYDAIKKEILRDHKLSLQYKHKDKVQDFKILLLVRSDIEQEHVFMNDIEQEKIKMDEEYKHNRMLELQELEDAQMGLYEKLKAKYDQKCFKKDV